MADQATTKNASATVQSASPGHRENQRETPDRHAQPSDLANADIVPLPGDATARRGGRDPNAETTPDTRSGNAPVRSVQKRPGRPFTSESARKARATAAENARRRKLEREEAARSAQLTYRQRLGMAMSQFTQEELNAQIRALHTLAVSGDTKAIHALARLADQAFGRAVAEQPADPRSIEEKDWDELTEAERAVVRRHLIAQAFPADDASDPRGDGADSLESGDPPHEAN